MQGPFKAPWYGGQGVAAFLCLFSHPNAEAGPAWPGGPLTAEVDAGRQGPPEWAVKWRRAPRLAASL